MFWCLETCSRESGTHEVIDSTTTLTNDEVLAALELGGRLLLELLQQWWSTWLAKRMLASARLSRTLVAGDRRDSLVVTTAEGSSGRGRKTLNILRR